MTARWNQLFDDRMLMLLTGMKVWVVKDLGDPERRACHSTYDRLYYVYRRLRSTLVRRLRDCSSAAFGSKIQIHQTTEASARRATDVSAGNACLGPAGLLPTWRGTAARLGPHSSFEGTDLYTGPLRATWSSAIAPTLPHRAAKRGSEILRAHWRTIQMPFI